MHYKKVATEVDLLIIALQWIITIVDHILNISFLNRTMGLITTNAFRQLKLNRDIVHAKV